MTILHLASEEIIAALQDLHVLKMKKMILLQDQTVDAAILLAETVAIKITVCSVIQKNHLTLIQCHTLDVAEIKMMKMTLTILPAQTADTAIPVAEATVDKVAVSVIQKSILVLVQCPKADVVEVKMMILSLLPTQTADEAILLAEATVAKVAVSVIQKSILVLVQCPKADVVEVKMIKMILTLLPDQTNAAILVAETATIKVTVGSIIQKNVLTPIQCPKADVVEVVMKMITLLQAQTTDAEILGIADAEILLNQDLTGRIPIIETDLLIIKQ